MSTAVIFGGCGFIGLYYAEEALNQKLFDSIYLIDLKEPDDDFCKIKYQKILKTGKVKFFKYDIRQDLNKIPILHPVDTILNFAAIHREPGHLDSEYFETNIKGATNICNFADHFKCNNIIFTSTIAVYGGGDHEKIETTMLLPTTPYGKSKLTAENIHISWLNSDLHNRTLSICRPGVVFGAGERGNVSRLIKIIKKRFFLYMGNKKIRKAGIYIKELVNILIWVNQNQLSKNISSLTLFNASIYPCPTLEAFSKNISQTLNISDNFINIPYSFIKFILFISSFILKNLSKTNSFNYKRINKLFISNNVKPEFLMSNSYPFKYNLRSSLDDWKETNSSDWT
jgi:nucleoside-diphosphate-sugar epimerase